MRVTSDIWVSALLRRVFAEGGFGAIVRRGATEAGAVFLVARNRFGETALFGPAPQTAYDSSRPDERQFSELAGGADSEAIDARLAKEMRFDPDIWVVEIEPGSTPLADLLALTKP
ncbi:DUF1491 family protein [Mesorhizobium sp. 1B3]|uniref:DUF1491 family protein n=1 Tax=Mesorhizobium sp. 1B3 TaxID=3243599 RepID=UPI003D9883EE